MSDIVTIESAEYSAEERRLKADPIIVAMARGVPAGVDMTSWEFVSAASRYYVKEVRGQRPRHRPVRLDRRP